ncbi:MAG: hypothetical protein CW691_02345 [Candidatus Bathyarchaeum sp.]|nr:MAG: hypothetical protein CW691_02345 [Candidatus Bathyarchaeum sp.]
MQSTSALKFTTPLKIVYSLTLGGVATGYLIFYLSYCLGNFGWTGDNVFSVFLRYLPFLFIMSVIPLTIFTLTFLTKGKGLDYFRSWNARKKLSISSLAIIIGYILVVFTPNTSIGRGYAPNHYDFYFTYFGLTLIALGFASIVLMYKRTVTSDKKSSSFEMKWRTRKAFLVFVAILIASVVIGGYILKIQTEYEHLQDNYQHLKEGLPFLVNDNWTNNENGNSKYINYNGAIFNSGLNTKHNITILVSVRDAEGNLLRMAEFPIGDIKGWQYEAFDVNVEYSGEMAKVHATYDWDPPPSFFEH